MEKELSASEWLKKHRNESCPLHGYHIARSLVRYSGYCRHCNQFWRYICYNQTKQMPYIWYYFDPETRLAIGKVFKGQHGKRTHHQNKTSRA